MRWPHGVLFPRCDSLAEAALTGAHGPTPRKHVIEPPLATPGAVQGSRPRLPPLSLNGWVAPWPCPGLGCDALADHERRGPQNANVANAVTLGLLPCRFFIRGGSLV